MGSNAGKLNFQGIGNRYVINVAKDLAINKLT